MAVSNVGNERTMQQIIDQTSSKANERKTGGELGKNDFLNLLVTQLRYQDPMKPVDDKEFIAQMAQFSSLEQMQNMNTTLAQSHAYSLIGKQVKAILTDETTKVQSAVEGEVTSIKMAGSKAFAVVNGKDIPIDKISDVTDKAHTTQNSNLAQYTNLIGFNVKGAVYDSETSNLIGVSGLVKAIQKGLYEDYAVMDGVNVEVVDIVTDTPSSDPNFKKNYLESNKGKEVSIYIVDRVHGQKVPVTATLKECTISTDGTIKAVLDQMNISVESVARIDPVK
jgi:flagellar basal-body rod modification protein FlgD